MISYFYIEGLTLAIFILAKVIVSCGTIKIHIDMLSVLLHTTKEPNIVFQNCRQDLMLSYPVFLFTYGTPVCSPIVPVAWAEFWCPSRYSCLTIFSYETYVMRCAIRYHLCNLIKVKNTNGGVSLLVSLQLY